MADYWKSQEKHYCDFCKCWTANNKSSIEFHERGKNHQANVKRRLAEIKKNSIEKRKKEESTRQMFAQMEKDALAAVQKDITGANSMVGKGDMKKIVEAHSDKKNTDLTDSTYPWTVMNTPQGFKYYYNSQTGESTWQMPEVFKELQRKKEKAERETENINSISITQDPYRKKQEVPTSKSLEVHSVHPLLGGWSTVETYTPEEETYTSSTDQTLPDTNEKSHDESVEATTSENTENRQSGKKFKEKALKTSLGNSEEVISFKKRRVKSRNVRRRDEDE